jgi:hypothetical protein
MTIAGAGLLLCLSLVGNLDSLRRSRRTVPRGIASSFVMRLEVDGTVIRDLSLDGGEQQEVRTTKVVPRDVTLTATHKTLEQKYNRCLELRDAIGLAPLGLMTNQVWYDDPRRLPFLLARYKFVAKMVAGFKDVGEVGCGDAFGTRVVRQEVPDVTVYDFDPLFIDDIRARQDPRWLLKADVHDIISGPLPRRHQALFSLDLIEHMPPWDEPAFLTNLCGSLAENGVLIIGTRSAESEAYASPPSLAGRLYYKNGRELKALLEQHFARVLLFSMSDEVVQAGFSPMADYLFAICTGPK